MKKQYVVIGKREDSAISKNTLITSNFKEAIHHFYSNESYGMEIWESGLLIKDLDYQAFTAQYPKAEYQNISDDLHQTEHGINMRCVCGYGHYVNDSGAVMPGSRNGEKPFVRIDGTNTDIQLYACPDCGTVKINQLK